MQNPTTKSGKSYRPASQFVLELRSRRGWSQEKLAEKSVLSPRTIQNLEGGKPTHRATIAKVAAALGVPTIECIAPTVTGPDNHVRSSLNNPGCDIPLCPYRGLLAFREEDAEIFFGRESLIELLKEKLEQKHIVQVSGPSGSGKSPLVAAGLIPALERSDSVADALLSSWNRSVQICCIGINAGSRAGPGRDIACCPPAKAP